MTFVTAAGCHQEEQLSYKNTAPPAILSHLTDTRPLLKPISPLNSTSGDRHKSECTPMVLRTIGAGNYLSSPRQIACRWCYCHKPSSRLPLLSARPAPTITKIGQRAVAVAGPTTWNSLPSDIRHITDTAAFLICILLICILTCSNLRFNAYIC